MKVDEISVAAYTVPTDAPESDGTLAWDKTTMVLVEVRAGDVSGLGYSYADLSVALLERLFASRYAPCRIFSRPRSDRANVF